jgi:hypothetical protein
MERVCFLSRVRPDRLAECSAAPFFADTGFFADTSGQRPGEGFRRIPEIFHLD